MTSPSKPVSIGASPRLRATDDSSQIQESSRNNTPDIRQQLRDRFGTPPVGTTIPAYRGSPAITSNIFNTGTPVNVSSPVPRSFTAIAQDDAVSSSIPNDTPFEATRSPPPELPEDEKIKVLRKHLVSSREPRSAQDTAQHSRQSSGRASLHESAGLAIPNRSSNGSPSHRPSRTPSPGPSVNAEPFPLPYNVPGGDITYVRIL